jgi:hypothetical protein
VDGEDIVVGGLGIGGDHALWSAAISAAFLFFFRSAPRSHRGCATRWSCAMASSCRVSMAAIVAWRRVVGKEEVAGKRWNDSLHSLRIARRVFRREQSYGPAPAICLGSFDHARNWRVRLRPPTAHVHEANRNQVRTHGPERAFDACPTPRISPERWDRCQ